ncbi:MAG: hypothetical protein QOI20_120 [Acidimicrobiaceae bacterium]|jgi:hypothetical protein|nr:hypothetical protein [Acidimicrobiaceae bacterium]
MPGAAKWCPTCRTPIDEGPASTRRTELPPEQAAATLTRALSGMGAHVTSQTSTAITGFVKVRRTPNVFVAILLFLLCIVPLVIYLIAQSKDDTFPFAFELVARNDGTEVRWSGTGPAADIARGAAGTLPA